MFHMATTKIGHSHGRSDAQPTRDNSDHQTSQQTEQAAPSTDPAVRARQRHTRAEIRRTKQRARYRDHEATVARRAGDADPAPRPDARDHRGKGEVV
jgi:hypothetical protein